MFRNSKQTQRFKHRVISRPWTRLMNQTHHTRVHLTICTDPSTLWIPLESQPAAVMMLIYFTPMRMKLYPLPSTPSSSLKNPIHLRPLRQCTNPLHHHLSPMPTTNPMPTLPSSGCPNHSASESQSTLYIFIESLYSINRSEPPLLVAAHCLNVTAPPSLCITDPLR